VSSSATRYGKAEFLPSDQRKGTALCLSGGDYRAALFHLGALRRLNELGILAQVDTLTSVSGGSIFAAQLATHLRRDPGAWPENGGVVSGWEEGVARPMRAFTRRNIRTGPALRGFHPLRVFDRNAATDALAARYAEGPAPGRLDELPDRPRFVICASDMRFREQWVFDTGTRRVGSRSAGYAPLGDRSLAEAVAASSCVPGAFGVVHTAWEPSELAGGAYDEPDRDQLVREIDLSDGGMFDNLGLEPVWRDHETVLVSDAAPSFKPDPKIGWVWNALRQGVILLEQATDARKRWLVANFIEEKMTGAYWGIASRPASYELDSAPEAYTYPFIRDFIAPVRIDLDVFTPGEIAVLENHGYLMAEIAVHKHEAGLVSGSWPELSVPHPEWRDEARAGNALRSSGKTKIFFRPRINP
jgi:NTE family protein